MTIPSPEAILITEIEPKPANTGNDTAQWVEIQNSGSNSISLNNTQINLGGTTVTVSTSVSLDPGEFAVFYQSGLSFSGSSGSTAIPVPGWTNLPTGGNDTSRTVTITIPSLDPVSETYSNGGGDPANTWDAVNDTYANATPVVCFLAGTHILTAEGEKPVETLKIGDLVRTGDGELAPIKWIGIETIATANLHPLRSYPVQIKAGSLGNGLPHRDLCVSPDHAMFFNGLLINAGALANGISIVQTPPTDETFVYYHVELEQHSLIVAEGAPTESYLPNTYDRENFDNVEEFEALYPDDSRKIHIPMSFPRVSSKRQLPRFVQKQLLEVAETLMPEQALQLA